MKLYRDLTLSKEGLELVVAKKICHWSAPNGEADNTFPGKFWEYEILTTI